MSVDKLVDSTQLDADLTSVANAIRTKGGTSADLAFPSGFVSAVQAIPSGGGGFNYDDLVNATRYSGEGSLGMVKRPAFTGVVNLTGTTLFPYAFTGMDITECIIIAKR